MLGYLKYMFQLLLMPSRGWEDISAESPVPEAMQSRGYYPLLALTAAAVFMQLLYRPCWPSSAAISPQSMWLT